MLISHLQTQALTAPLGLDETRPVFSWQLFSDIPGDRQTAWQILCSDSPETLTEADAALWNSRKMPGERPFGIAYAGQMLTSRQQVWWRARVWDAAGEPSPWSEPAMFEMGLLCPEDRVGYWIGRGDAPEDETLEQASRAPALSTVFSIGHLDQVKKARLYISGLGLFDCAINGRAVTENLYEPGESEFAKRVFYCTYDVLPLLREGENVLAVLLGNGQYANYAVAPVMRMGDGTLCETHRYQKDDTCFLREGICGRKKLLAQLELTDLDGNVTMITTDESWHLTESPITFQNWYGGEDYDARIGTAYALPGTDRSTYAHAKRMMPPKGVLSARPCPPVRIWERWTAASVRTLPNGHLLVDMGRNSAGFVTLHLHNTQGLRGQVIELYPAEVLGPDGRVDQASVTQSCSSIYSCTVKDQYTIAGTGDEVWHPRFCYHGFQYVEVVGFPGEATVENFEGCAVRVDNPAIGSFQCDVELLNQIAAITDRSIASNMMWSFTDCPQIEKLGWLETTHLMFSSMASGFDLRAWMPKLTQDMADSQTDGTDLSISRRPDLYPGADFASLQMAETEDDGYVPVIAPTYFRIGGLCRDPNWGGACILTPWCHYWEYGDETLLRRHYPMMKRYLAHLEQHADHGVLRGYAQMGEWGEFGEHTPETLVATCAHYLLTTTLSKIAAVLKDDAESARCAALAAQIRDGFYQDAECYAGGQFGTGSQASYGCALFSGIARDEDRPKLLNLLCEAVAKNGDHLTSGEVGLKQVFATLADNGHNDVVYRMVTNPTAPSYANFVRHGMTTLPEYWNYDELWHGLGRSRNHAMMGHVKEWLVCHVLGIRPTSPGYRTMVIRPWLTGPVQAVSGTRFTPYGMVQAAFHVADDVLNVEVQIPVGCTAEVMLDRTYYLKSGTHTWQIPWGEVKE